MAIGFNQNPEDKIKHYRRFYPDELENIDDMMGDKPFNEFDILRGASRGNKAGLFSGMFGKPKTDDSSTFLGSRTIQVTTLLYFRSTQIHRIKTILKHSAPRT